MAQRTQEKQPVGPQEKAGHPIALELYHVERGPRSSVSVTTGPACAWPLSHRSWHPGTGYIPRVRIVSLLPSATEIVFELGLADSLVGRSNECTYPPEVLNRPV